jgi:hypothetical protein
MVTVKSRPSSYTYKDKDDNIKTSTGSEIVHEVRVCRPCAGEPPLSAPEVVDLNRYLGMVAGSHIHAKKCNGFKVIKDDAGEEIDRIECKVCIGIKEQFRSMPLQVLSVGLEDKLATPVRVSLGSLVLDAMMTKSYYTSKQGKADFAESYRILKDYEKRGGGI